MVIESWTYIIMMFSIATFPSADYSRDWLYLAGPYTTLEECRKNVVKEPEKVSHSQCMSAINARAITQPYNRGSFVLIRPKKSMRL